MHNDVTRTEDSGFSIAPTTSSPIISLFGQQGDPLGKLWEEDGVLQFEGVPSAAAKVFFNHVIQLHSATIVALQDEIERLQGRVDVYSPNHTRYLWLFEHGPHYHDAIPGTPSMSECTGPYVLLEPPSCNNPSAIVPSKQLADQIIDAAIKKHKGNNK